MKQSKWRVVVTFQPDPETGETHTEPKKIINLSPMERGRAEEAVQEKMGEIEWPHWSAEYERIT